MKASFIKVAVTVIGLLSAGQALACDGCAINVSVYDQLYNHYCRGNSNYILDQGAQEIARLAARGEVDVDAFLADFDRSCDYGSAKNFGSDVRRGDAQLKVYTDLYGHYCGGNSNYILDQGAQEIAKLAARGEISVEAFVAGFDRSCDYSSAKNLGKDVQNGRSKLKVYTELLGHYCRGNSNYILDQGAQEIARLSAEERISVKGFKDVFDRSCDYGSAKSAGMKAKEGRLDLEVYDRLYGHYCSGNSNYILDQGAQEIAEMAARGQIDVATFLNVFDRSCDYGSAKSVAQCDVVGANLESILGSNRGEANSSVYSGSKDKAANSTAAGGESIEKAIESAGKAI